MADILGVPDPSQLTAADFQFRVGRTNDPSTWAVAPTPAISVRPGAGAGGSDRFTFTWPDHAIRQQWLEVKVKSGPNTLLAEDDLFYFGNAIGETGNDPRSALVTSVDVIGARDNQRGPFNQASITDVYDFNRDRMVSSIDVIMARDNQVGPITAVPLIRPPARQDDSAAAPGSAVGNVPAGGMALTLRVDRDVSQQAAGPAREQPPEPELGATDADRNSGDQPLSESRLAARGAALRSIARTFESLDAQAISVALSKTIGRPLTDAEADVLWKNVDRWLRDDAIGRSAIVNLLQSAPATTRE
jgi:hypothetical protein